MVNKRLILIGLIGIAMAAVAGPAAAQTAPRGVSVGFLTGSVSGIYSDDSAAKPVFGGTVRYDGLRYVTLEVEAAHWGSVSRRERGPSQFESSGGGLVQLDSVTTTESGSTWAGSVNVLAHSTGSVRFFGGGGVGYGSTRDEYVVTVSGCRAPSGSIVCDGTSTQRQKTGLMFQGIGGLEADISKRLTAFGSFRVRSGYTLQPHTIGVVAGVTVKVG